MIAYQYPQILFTYTDKVSLQFLRNKVGITWDDFPSFGLFNNEGISPIVFPRKQPFTTLNMNTFLDCFMNGTIYNKNFTLPDVNINFGNNMENAFEIQFNYTLTNKNESNIDRLFNSTADTLLLIFNSSSSFIINDQVTHNFESLASLFKEIEARTVDFAYLDVSNSFVPESIKNNNPLPHIQFLPAFHKNITPFKVIPSMKIKDVVEYIRKNAEINLTLAFRKYDHKYPKEPEQTQEHKIKEDL